MCMQRVAKSTKVLRAGADAQRLRITKARLLTSARLPREALAEIDAGLASAPSAPVLLAAAATSALDYANRLRAVAPRDRAARVALGNALLATGRAQEALEIADALHDSDPADGLALAVKADALRMLGDPRYRALLDYQHLVRAESIDVPAGWTGLDAYLAELIAGLDRAHTLRPLRHQRHLVGAAERVLRQPLGSGRLDLVRVLTAACRGAGWHRLVEVRRAGLSDGT